MRIRIELLRNLIQTPSIPQVYDPSGVPQVYHCGPNVALTDVVDEVEVVVLPSNLDSQGLIF